MTLRYYFYSPDFGRDLCVPESILAAFPRVNQHSLVQILEFVKELLEEMGPITSRCGAWKSAMVYNLRSTVESLQRLIKITPTEPERFTRDSVEGIIAALESEASIVIHESDLTSYFFEYHATAIIIGERIKSRFIKRAIRKNIALQLNGAREEDLLLEQAALNKIGMTNPIYYGLIAFSDEIVEIDKFYDYDVVVPFGSTKLIRLWQQGFLPDMCKIFYDAERFDQRTYAPILGELLLNHHTKFTTLGAVKDIPVNQVTFIKPTSDLKAFAGLIIEKGLTPGEEIYSRQIGSDLTDDEPVLMAPYREILKEFRNFVVGGELIDTSIYKIKDQVKYIVPTQAERDMVARFLSKVAQLYEPLNTYVVDVALMETGELTVIEYNCLNCSGQYSIDRAKLFKAVLDLE